MATVVVEIIMYINNKENIALMKGYKYMHVPMLLFLFVWFILGNVWWFGDMDCENFPHGYYTTFALLMIYYFLFFVVFGFVIGIIVLICTKRYGMLSQLKSKLLGQPYDVIE